MAKHVVNSDSEKTFEIKTSGDVWQFGQSVSLKDDAIGLLIEPTHKGNDIFFDGSIKSQQVAIFGQADRTSIHIGKQANLDAGAGAVIYGDKSSIVNEANISTSLYGFTANTGDNQSIENSGKVSSGIGIQVGQDSGNIHILNAKGGSIIGDDYGVAISSASGDTSHLVNHGTISGKVYAVVTQLGNDHIVNDGKIKGAIVLNEGNDTFDNRGGEIKNGAGGVTGGAGDDTLITDSAKVKLIETVSGGDDTVKSTVSYTLSDNIETLFLLGNKDIKGTGDDLNNALHGNSGDNVLKGALGTDHLYGGKGSDSLFGGGDADTFHFSTGDGKDTIADFENAYDFIDVSGWKAIVDFTDVMTHIQFVDGDAIISAGKDVLVIENVIEADLDAGDFKFAI